MSFSSRLQGPCHGVYRRGSRLVPSFAYLSDTLDVGFITSLGDVETLTLRLEYDRNGSFPTVTRPTSNSSSFSPIILAESPLNR